jgi:hypothetical protein
VACDFEPALKTDPAVTVRLLTGQGTPGVVHLRKLARLPRSSTEIGVCSGGVMLSDAIDYCGEWEGTELRLVARDCRIFSDGLADRLLGSGNGSDSVSEGL